MTESEKQANRIPFETLQESAVVSQWNLPKVSPRGGAIKSAAREALDKALAKKKLAAQKAQESIEDVPVTKKPKPMTAEELMRIGDEARAEGFDAGYKEGLAKGEQEGFASGQKSGEIKAYQQTRQQQENVIKRFKDIATALMQPMLDQQQDIENVIVEMAVTLAKQLLVHEIQQSPSVLYKLVNHALTALPVGARNISVFLHPEDAELLRDILPTMNEWKIHEDPSITAGGCRIQTEQSLVDFTVETRLNAYLEEIRLRGNVDEKSLPEVENFRDPEIEGLDNPGSLQQAQLEPETDIESKSNSESKSENAFLSGAAENKAAQETPDKLLTADAVVAETSGQTDQIDQADQTDSATINTIQEPENE